MKTRMLAIALSFSLGVLVVFTGANYRNQSITDAQWSMFFHLNGNDFQPQPLSNTGCQFREHGLTAYPYTTFGSWEWNGVFECFTLFNVGSCQNMALVTLWAQSGKGKQIMEQKCVDITQKCGTPLHIITGDIAPDFPKGYPPATYWINVGIWDGSCANPGSTLIDTTNSPTYVLQ